MTWLFLGIPAEPDEPYDPRDDDLDEAAPSNQYLTKRDAKIILLGLVLLALILWPLFLKMKADRERYGCGLNIHAISVAMLSYAVSNDDHFPPCFVPGATGPLPRTDLKHRPYTWASTLANIVGIDKDRSFQCPSATPEEGMIAEGVAGADLVSDYGMYVAESAASTGGSSSSGSTVLIAETANDGAEDTFDPTPLPPEDDGSVRDGFLLGWAGSNSEPPSGDALRGSAITRLAFKKTKAGLTSKSDQGRHDDSIYVIFADGHYQLVKASRLLSSRLWQLPSP